MTELLIATRNKGKLKELSVLLKDVPFNLVLLDDVGIDDEVEETGATFEENATLKAVTYASLSGLPTLADDSGLEVDALGGEPGVYSSRYAGEGATDEQRIARLLENLHKSSVTEESWHARFRCVIAVRWPDERIDLFEGECPGKIISEPRGTNGFGYDPAFLIPRLGKTMAELTEAEKNEISHRSVAARKAAKALRNRSVIS